jgi:Xaa-Pro aminopeptidase
MTRKYIALAPIIAVILIGASRTAPAERLEYPPAEFQQRRAALCAELMGAIGDDAQDRGTVLLFADTSPPVGVRFRQDHDFYYLTGNEDKNAALAMDVASCDAWLFLPPQTAREASRDGWNWLQQDGAAERWGFETIHPLHYFDEFLARRRVSGRQNVWARLSERDLIDQSRTDAGLFFARRLANPWGGQPSEDAWRVTQLRDRYPHYALLDVTPHIDELRMHKTKLETEALRRTGRISARAIERAIAFTAPDVYEYEIEAEATHEMIRNGAEHPAYPAIVGAGANGNIWHYTRNGDRVQSGQLIVMDYGASLAYQTMDITRTWPVSGEFTELQLRAFRAVLEAQKAIIAALKPGVLRDDTEQIARDIFDKHGFEGHYPGGAGHFVGMAVHDVGDYDRPLEEGMVIAVEPIIEIPEEGLHIRIEDTVLITKDGVENLSAGVPKEIDELLALVGRDR